MKSSERAVAFVRAALDGEAERVRGTGPGGRNRALRAAAFSLGTLVGAGALPQEEAEGVLLAAAEEAGLPEAEARSVVARGLRDGAKSPREIPGGSTQRRASPTPAPTAERRGYPPAAEVEALWESSVSVADDAEVARWLCEARGIDPEAAALEHLARALPPARDLPRWAWGPARASWAETGHRLLVPMFDARGVRVTVRARTVLLGVEPKSLAPSGYAVHGAVMADLVARSLLRGERPESWSGVVVVVEGEPDLLSWATNRTDAIETVPAVLGVEAGAWTAEIASRVPDGARVVVRTHHDEAGNRYAEAIVRTLGGRCEMFRSRVGEVS